MVFPIELIFLYLRLRFGADFFIFGHNWSQYSSERAVSHSHSPRVSGCLGNFVGFSPDKPDYVRRVDAEEDVQDLGQPRPCLDAFQAIPPDELYCIRRVDAKEDVQDFGQLRPCLDAFQATDGHA